MLSLHYGQQALACKTAALLVRHGLCSIQDIKM